MGVEFISPVGRLVQGSISLETKIDSRTNKPKLDDNGQPIKELFIAIAIRKDDPGLGAFYGLFVAAAKAEFPALFDAAGNCTNPKFAWKIQDGDGRDSNGQSVADKPGFAGHWIFKMATRYMPKCFHAGKYDPTQQIPNPAEVIKRGYFVRVAGQLRGNGWTPADRDQVPGLFVSPNLIEFIAFGEEIVGGPDAAKVFGAAPAVTALPPGASSTPTAPSGAAVPGLAPPPMPGATPGLPPAAPQAAPQLPGATPAAPAVPALPGAAPAAIPALPGAAPAVPTLPAAQPQYVMTAKAMGATREQLHAQNWTDALLVEHGLMVIQ